MLGGLYKDVYHFALKLCQSRVLAEDLAQETFLRAWRFHHTLRDTKYAKAWLFKILKNEKKRLFDHKRIEYVGLDFIVASAASAPRDFEPEQRAESHLLRRAVAELEDNYSEPLTMQVFDGCTGKEIAARLNLNGNTVMTRLHRARGKLYRHFELEG